MKGRTRLPLPLILLWLLSASCSRMEEDTASPPGDWPPSTSDSDTDDTATAIGDTETRTDGAAEVCVDISEVQVDTLAVVSPDWEKWVTIPTLTLEHYIGCVPVDPGEWFVAAWAADHTSCVFSPVFTAEPGGEEWWYVDGYEGTYDETTNTCE